MHFSVLFVLAGAWTVVAKNIIITVGSNTTGNGTTTFIPQRVDAASGDVVIFNFTLGNHTATQSTFSSPCVPAHDTDSAINGFNSAFRYTQPGTAGTTLTVPIQNETQTFWFFDYNTCGEGGVGVINNNQSSSETLAGFSRNAIRLNGTGTSDNATTSASSRTSPTTSPSPSTSARKSAAEHAYTVGAIGVIPLFLASLFA
ncbi:hypothetical protein BC827DRAFT_1272057 [Russula dissimulans]|nr:hypothetical protein BC827DRAFT_1272057 [Russula dissimulans]